jgi:hypothetical protein
MESRSAWYYNCNYNTYKRAQWQHQPDQLMSGSEVYISHPTLCMLISWAMLQFQKGSPTYFRSDLSVITWVSDLE